MSRRKRSEQDERLARARAGWVEVRAEAGPTTRRERALEAAFEALREYDRATIATGYIGKPGGRTEAIVDAVLAVPCDCAERLDAEADRIRHNAERWAFGQAYRAAARFLRGES